MTISPIIRPRNGVPDTRSRTFSSAIANAIYIVRQLGTDVFVPRSDLAGKLALGNDLLDHGRRGPIGCNSDTPRGRAPWEIADRAAKTDRPSAPVAYRVIDWLPTNKTGRCGASWYSSFSIGRWR